MGCSNVIEYIFDENVKENGRDNWSLWKDNTSLEPYSYVIIHYMHLTSRWLRNAFIQFHTFPLTPLLDSFTMSPSLHMLSYAFSKSINMAAVDFDMLKPLKMSWVSDKSALND